MLFLKERVVYQASKLFIEYSHKGDINIYTLVIETITGEIVTLYAHDSKKIIDFIFDAIIAEMNGTTNKVIDVNYIISNACE